MAPKNINDNNAVAFDSPSDDPMPTRPGGGKKILSNQQLMPDAGKVPLKPADSWGRGLCNDFKNCVIDWWVPVRIHRMFRRRYRAQLEGAP